MTFLPTLEHARRLTRQTSLGRAAERRLLERAAAHRASLTDVQIVGVTGSSGKTTTKELIAAVLGAELRGTKSAGTSNGSGTVARTVLRTRPGDGFAVVEVAAWQQGTVAVAAQVLRPTTAVVTTIGDDHRKAFRTRAATAAEKRALVDAVVPGGTAILNADDPHVRAMADGFAGRVLTVGTSPDAELRAEDAASAWPDRLTFSLVHEGRTYAVSTRLCGKTWTTSVLAALAVGLENGVALDRALAAVERFEPIPGRMSPETVDGITFIRDDWKAPLPSFDSAFEFLREARSGRKAAVIGAISDFAGSSSSVYPSVARRALEVAEEVVFAGPQARHALRACADRSRLRSYESVREAADDLRRTLRAGDLVLLKGSNPASHLSRVVLVRSGDIRCWRERCGRRGFCEACWLRRLPG